MIGKGNFFFSVEILGSIPIKALFSLFFGEAHVVKRQFCPLDEADQQTPAILGDIVLVFIEEGTNPLTDLYHAALSLQEGVLILVDKHEF